MAKNTTQNEWPYLVSVQDMERGARVYDFEASEQECVDLARRLGVEKVESARAHVSVQGIGGNVYHAIGQVSADIIQNCAVSLVAIPTHLDEEFEGWFRDQHSTVSFVKAKTEREAKKGHIETEILDEAVDPEPIIGGKMDLGELATQYLSLAIDPYVRAADAPGEYLIVSPEQKAKKGDVAGAEIRKNPFEALKAWKDKL